MGLTDAIYTRLVSQESLIHSRQSAFMIDLAQVCVCVCFGVCVCVCVCVGVCVFQVAAGGQVGRCLCEGAGGRGISRMVPPL